MNPLKNVLKGHTWVGAGIFGVATVYFFYMNSTLLFGDLFNRGYSSWDWKNFWASLCVYGVMTVVAWLTTWMSRA